MKDYKIPKIELNYILADLLETKLHKLISVLEVEAIAIYWRRNHTNMEGYGMYMLLFKSTAFEKQTEVK